MPTVTCPRCAGRVETDLESLGQQVYCPACDDWFSPWDDGPGEGAPAWEPGAPEPPEPEYPVLVFTPSLPAPALDDEPMPRPGLSAAALLAIGVGLVVVIGCTGFFVIQGVVDKPKPAVVERPPQDFNEALVQISRDTDRAVEKANAQWTTWMVIDSMIGGVAIIAGIALAFRYGVHVHHHRD